MPKILTNNGIIRYKTHPLYLGIKRIDKVKAKENLLLLRELLNIKKVHFGLLFGTLLGAVREHDFITHDEDIDLFILEEERESFINCLPEILQNGFIIARYSRGHEIISILRNGEYIDIYFYKTNSNQLRDCGGHLLPSVFLDTMSEIIFLGVPFTTVSNPIEFLKFEYGLDWQTPIQYTDFNVSKLKRFCFTIKELLKDLLPNSLYFKLQAPKWKRNSIKSYMKMQLYDELNQRIIK